MKILVPFLFEAQIVKPRCRKATCIIVRDSVEVELKEFTAAELPIAIRFDNNDLRFDGQNLWSFYLQQIDFNEVTDKTHRKVSISEVVSNTNDCSAYKWSCPGPTAPFHNFWRNSGNYRTLGAAWLKDDGILQREDVVYREWVSDNREEIVALAHQIASGLCIMDNLMMRRTSEPRYNAITFGLGNNHGGTSLMTTNHFNTNLKPESYFRADELDKAIEYTTTVATNRGDTENLPIKASEVIEILIPEAVQLQIPKSWS